MLQQNGQFPSSHRSNVRFRDPQFEFLEGKVVVARKLNKSRTGYNKRLLGLKSNGMLVYFSKVKQKSKVQQTFDAIQQIPKQGIYLSQAERSVKHTQQAIEIQIYFMECQLFHFDQDEFGYLKHPQSKKKMEWVFRIKHKAVLAQRPLSTKEDEQPSLRDAKNQPNNSPLKNQQNICPSSFNSNHKNQQKYLPDAKSSPSTDSVEFSYPQSAQPSTKTDSIESDSHQHHLASNIIPKIESSEIYHPSSSKTENSTKLEYQVSIHPKPITEFVSFTYDYFVSQESASSPALKQISQNDSECQRYLRLTHEAFQSPRHLFDLLRFVADFKQKCQRLCEAMVLNNHFHQAASQENVTISVNEYNDQTFNQTQRVNSLLSDLAIQAQDVESQILVLPPLTSVVYFKQFKFLCSLDVERSEIKEPHGLHAKLFNHYLEEKLHLSLPSQSLLVQFHETLPGSTAPWVYCKFPQDLFPGNLRPELACRRRPKQKQLEGRGFDQQKEAEQLLMFRLVDRLEHYEVHCLSSLDLVHQMHEVGLRVSSLGVFVEMCQAPYLKDFCLIEMISRTCKKIMREECEGDYEESLKNLVYLLTEEREGSHDFWSKVLSKQIYEKFHYQIGHEPSRVPRGGLLLSLQRNLGFEIKAINNEGHTDSIKSIKLVPRCKFPKFKATFAALEGKEQEEALRLRMRQEYEEILDGQATLKSEYLREGKEVERVVDLRNLLDANRQTVVPELNSVLIHQLRLTRDLEYYELIKELQDYFYFGNHPGAVEGELLAASILFEREQLEESRKHLDRALLGGAQSSEGAGRRKSLVLSKLIEWDSDWETNFRRWAETYLHEQSGPIQVGAKIDQFAKQI